MKPVSLVAEFIFVSKGSVTAIAGLAGADALLESKKGLGLSASDVVGIVVVVGVAKRTLDPDVGSVKLKGDLIPFFSSVAVVGAEGVLEMKPENGEELDSWNPVFEEGPGSVFSSAEVDPEIDSNELGLLASSTDPEAFAEKSVEPKAGAENEGRAGVEGVSKRCAFGASPLMEPEGLASFVKPMPKPEDGDLIAFLVWESGAGVDGGELKKALVDF